MKQISMKLQNCYGIKNLEYVFDFNKKSNYLLYASNGMMKTSFTKTMKAIASKKKPLDEVFERKTSCEILVDEAPITPEQVFVINSYEDEYISPNSAKLMVQKELKIEYDSVMKDIAQAQESLYLSLKAIMGETTDIGASLSEMLECHPVDVLEEISRAVDNGMLSEPYFNIDFSKVKYEDIICPAVYAFLKDKKNLAAMQEYSERYSELLSKSPIFKRGVFSHNNADNISESLASNGFFDADHKIILSGINKQIESASSLAQALDEERQKIFSDVSLKKKFEKINAALGKRALAKFRGFIEIYPEAIPLLTDYSSFRRMLWVALLNNVSTEVEKTIKKYKESQHVVKKIKEKASQERTQWDTVLEIFKSRFSVPFTIKVPNQEDVSLLGNMPEFVFRYVDTETEEETDLPRKNLEKVLSQGEKRALFLLNIINDLEALKLSNTPCLVIADDIAESFDYKNKYAIIEYLQEMMSDSNLHFIVLTHNFDFYRTVANRAKEIIAPLMVQRVKNGLEIVQPKYVFKNPFELMRKGVIQNNDKDIVTSIPFIRNIIEYTRGSKDDANYDKLTSLLHIKERTKEITMKELEDIFNAELGTTPTLNFSNGREDEKVYNLIISLAQKEAQQTKETIELDGKIIISIAIRLMAEEFIIARLKEKNVDISNIENNQTGVLVGRYKEQYPLETENIKNLNNVLLMSSENIHINSFMFEPLIDTSIKALIDLFGMICILQLGSS